jgi:hypothetical protein
MVLQPPSNSSNRDLLDQTAPANDEDPFAESGPRPDSSNNYQIEQSLQTNRSLLRPFPLSFKFTSYEDEWRKMTTARILQTQKLVQRPLTQSEVDAITELGAGMLSVVSYGTPIGFAAGLYGAYRTASTFRFPLYQPNLDTFQPGVFPPTMGFIRGHRAIWAWHASRVLAYTLLNVAVSDIVVSSYAATTATVKAQTDPRLKDVNTTFAERVRSNRGLPRAPVQQKHSGGQIPHDDASPSGSLYGDEGSSTENSYGTGRPNSEQPSSIGWNKRPKDPPLEEVRESEDGGFAVYDDASPTGGQGVGADTSQPQTSGSAWDRLRRGEKPIQNAQAGTDGPETAAQPVRQSAWAKLRNNPQQGQGDISRTDESYSYSDSNEQRDLAKAQAQKEFDAQIERERRGGDFNSGGGDQKRW